MTDLTNEPIENLVKIFFDKNTYHYGYSDSDAHSAAKLLIAKGYRFSPDELKIIMVGEYPCSGSTYAHFLADNNYIFTIDELIDFGNPSDAGRNTVAHHMVENGYDGFTCDNLIALRDSMNYYRETISIKMAKRGHHFKLDEIIRLGNPADTYRISLAHLMAHHCEFSVDELWSLRNSLNHSDVPVAEMWKLRNPADRDGDTVAHWMAKAGHCFSVEELKFLNNPKNKFGDSIAHIMMQGGHNFSKNESEELGLPLEIEQKSIFLDMKNGCKFDDGFYGGFFSELYVNGQLCLSNEYSHSGFDITIFNQEVFSAFVNYACIIQPSFDEKTFRVYKGSPARINRKYTILTDPQAAAMMVYMNLFDEKAPISGLFNLSNYTETMLPA